MLVAGLMLAAGLMALQPQARADLDCLATVAYLGGSDANKTSAEMQQGLAATVMYYLDRLEGRQPGIDVQSLLVELVSSSGFKSSFKGNAQRCGNEMIARGAALKEMGAAMTALPGPARAGK